MMQEEDKPLMEEKKEEAPSCCSGAACDIESQKDDSKGHESVDASPSSASASKMKIQLLSMVDYLKREMGNMDANKAREKVLALVLALKQLLLKYYEGIAALDGNKAKELGAKCRGKAVAGYHELRSIDRTQAKQKGIKFMKEAKSMSTSEKIKVGLLFGFCFFLMSAENKGAVRYGHSREHPNLCYINQQGKYSYTESCEMMLREPAKGANRWIFLGNQPMSSLLQPVKSVAWGKKNPFQTLNSDQGKRSKNFVYYHYEPADKDTWLLKYSKQENGTPTEIATQYGRSDCAQCHQFKMKDKERDFTFEYLTLESSRDVHITTNTTETTQETILKYIGENYHIRDKTACVIQTGTYEQDKAPWRSTSDYLTYTHEFHKSLEKYCGTLVRIGMFHGSRHSSRHDDWDHGARDSLLDYIKDGYFIDVSNVRSPSKDSYTLPVFKMMTRLMGIDQHDYK